MPTRPNAWFSSGVTCSCTGCDRSSKSICANSRSAKPGHGSGSGSPSASRPPSSRRASAFAKWTTRSWSIVSTPSCRRSSSSRRRSRSASLLRKERRRIEAERDRLRLLLERLHEGVLTIDQDLVVHFANAEARRLLGGRLAEGDALPEPWQSFGLREFAQSLFDERAS